MSQLMRCTYTGEFLVTVHSREGHENVYEDQWQTRTASFKFLRYTEACVITERDAWCNSEILKLEGAKSSRKVKLTFEPITYERVE